MIFLRDRHEETQTESSADLQELGIVMELLLTDLPEMTMEMLFRLPWQFLIVLDPVEWMLIFPCMII